MTVARFLIWCWSSIGRLIGGKGAGVYGNPDSAHLMNALKSTNATVSVHTHFVALKGHSIDILHEKVTKKTLFTKQDNRCRYKESPGLARAQGKALTPT